MDLDHRPSRGTGFLTDDRAAWEGGDPPMTPRTNSSFITNKQIALLHVAKKQLGLDDDTYRAILARYGRCESAADLTQPGFTAVVKYFTAMGFRSTWTQRTYGYRPTMATPAQVDLIRSLWRKYLCQPDEGDTEIVSQEVV
ncbi:phage protein GemA/Gp16 family protein [Ensifer soli]|uniref:phage protein GemA/Gp16 family protein n=1 Tax=Ciceribacter sp. sgz301302 TaxID=3342379 RepID=UPI0035B6ECE0